MKILQSLLFYPRGGSAQVVRYLSRALIDLGHEVYLATGSLLDGDPQHDARVFYQDIPLVIANYTEAWLGFEGGRDPIAEDWDIPFHPSYEDKPEVPDRVFYKVTHSQYGALLRSWESLFRDLSGRYQPDLIHLHHLNHMHLAAREIFPVTPRSTQLHGTEIKMLENMALLEVDSHNDPELQSLWRDVLHRAADSVDHFFAISPDVRDRGMAEFSIEESRVTTLANGVDISLFKPLDWVEDKKIAFLRQVLVNEPAGWDESGVPGSVHYSEKELEAFKTQSGRLKPLVIFVGRFLDFKRLPLLIRAVARVNDRFETKSDWPPYNLLIWGGMPGEWEGQHPYTLVRELELSNVFFTGWLPHDILSRGLNLADVFVAPSYYEPFGQVYLEAMATGMPVIATRSGGPLSFVAESGPDANGWFAEVDDVDSLAETLYRSLIDEDESKRRGENGLKLIRSKYSWQGIARQYVRAYKQLIE